MPKRSPKRISERRPHRKIASKRCWVLCSPVKRIWQNQTALMNGFWNCLDSAKKRPFEEWRTLRLKPNRANQRRLGLATGNQVIGIQAAMVSARGWMLSKGILRNLESEQQDEYGCSDDQDRSPPKGAPASSDHRRSQDATSQQIVLLDPFRTGNRRG